MNKQMTVDEALEFTDRNCVDLGDMSSLFDDACIALADEVRRLRGDLDLLKPDRRCDAGRLLSCKIEADYIKTVEAERDALREAAIAVVQRWDTPLWKDVPATAGYINRLRNAL